MAKRTLIMMQGLPASGKSTWAREFVAKNPDKAFRVNRDDMRDMLFDYRYSKPNEKVVRASRDELVQLLFAHGASYVIVDDTNLDPHTQRHVRALADLCDAELEVRDFRYTVGLSTCLERNSRRTGRHLIPEASIIDMYDKYVKRASAINAGSKSAIIVDLDGTLAHRGSGAGVRGYYDYDRVDEDVVDQEVLRVVDLERNSKTSVLVVTGREDTGLCREKTDAWLRSIYVPYDMLLMRKEGDRRKDHVVKQELYFEHIEPSDYAVNYVLDDRATVVEMWRSIGLKCFQVERGDF